MRLLVLLLLSCKPMVANDGVELLAAQPNVSVAEQVKSELGRAHKDGRQLLVYVGASWCEPCRYFHDAAKAGKLDRTFPRLRLVEFDHDRDGAGLEAAGYKSQLIPLFARPNPDGKASGQHIEGSIKGPGAVDEITPRLRSLLTP